MLSINVHIVRHVVDSVAEAAGRLMYVTVISLPVTTMSLYHAMIQWTMPERARGRSCVLKCFSHHVTSSKNARCQRAGRHGAPPELLMRMGCGEAFPSC